ncbi:hypothetical protein MPSEU_000158800 [Mayamaea pseudoterrestris]|nr:hypothetical protein MPSEU_000158800 [Mayamaea pseudoterrestris]
MSRQQQERTSEAIKTERFKAHFGSMPVVYASIWRDLVTSDLPKARIDPVKARVEQANQNHKGEPRWDGSAASAFLSADFDEYIAQQRKPIELYMSRDEY